MHPQTKGNGTTRARHKKKRGNDQSKAVIEESKCNTARGLGNPLKSAFPNPKTDSSRTKKKGDSSSPREERTTSKSNSLLDKYGQTNKKSIAQNVIEQENNLNSVVENDGY